MFALHGGQFCMFESVEARCASIFLRNGHQNGDIVQSSRLRHLLLGIAVILTIAIARGTYVLSKRGATNPTSATKRIVFDLARPAELKSHIKEWIPAYSGDQPERLGTIEDEPVLLVIKDADEECSFESELITVDIDPSQNGKVERIFIASKAMTLDQAVGSMKKILTILRADQRKLSKWTRGALAWTKNPKNWPTNTLTPPDAWYSQAGSTEGKWYGVEIIRSGNDTKPWRITLRTGPSD